MGTGALTAARRIARSLSYIALLPAALPCAAQTYPYFPPPGTTWTGATHTFSLANLTLTSCADKQIPVSASGALTCSSNFQLDNTNGGLILRGAAAINLANSVTAPGGQGDVLIQAGTDVNGVGSDAEIDAGSALANNHQGGQFLTNAGSGNGSGAGGNYNASAGNGDVGGTGAGGSYNALAGNGGGLGGAGGGINFQAGGAQAGNAAGGSVTFTPGSHSGSGAHGQVLLQDETAVTQLTLDTTGALCGAPTGSFKGSGSLNCAAGVFDNGTRLRTVLTGTTAAIGGSPLVSGACAAGTVSIGGATSTMVATASPSADPDSTLSTGVALYAFVSSTNTITVRVCAIVAVTPAAVTYNVRVLQ